MTTSSISAAELRTRSLALKAKADALRPILRRQARRPYFVELAGTPKAGKTTALHVLDRFLKSCGYQVHQMRERAADCPIAMKGHFFFNTWTTTTMLASVIESLESEADVVLLDRGVFDALVWLEMQTREHQVTTHEHDVFQNFVMLSRWRKLTDLTVVLEVAPAKAVERENKDLLLERTGSIMAPEYLERYNAVLREARAAMSDKFLFVDIDTNLYDSPQATSYAIANKLLDRMSNWADPEIIAIPKSVAERVFKDSDIRALPEAIDEVEGELVSCQRSTLEKRDDVVGLVGAAVLRHAGKLLLLRRSEEHDYKRTTFGPDVLWKGCHLTHIAGGTSSLLTTAASALEDRLKEDFHLARFGSEPIPRVLVWDRSNPRIARHVGVFFDLEIPTDELAQSLSSKVFKRERNRTKLGGNQFVVPSELLARADRHDDIDLEPWSLKVLRHMTEWRR